MVDIAADAQTKNLKRLRTMNQQVSGFTHCVFSSAAQKQQRQRMSGLRHLVSDSFDFARFVCQQQ